MTEAALQHRRAQRPTAETTLPREDRPIGGTGNPYYLGIDLGTTFTAAAVCRGAGRTEMADLGSHGPVTPSVVLLRDDGELLCGEAAQRRAPAEPQRVAREFKRRIGDPTPMIVDGTPFAADALMAKLLGWVADAVRTAQGAHPAGVAITHPANWGEYKLDVLRQAIRTTAISNVTLVSEPEAAAIHYATQERIADGAIVAVYDLGGGTFDSAVLRRTATRWQVLGQPEGIERLGGIDVDEAVFHHVIEAAGIADLLESATAGPSRPAEDDSGVQAAAHRLREDCISAKEALSADTDATIPVMLPGSQSQVRLTRAELEAMVRPTFAPTIGALERSLASAKVRPDEIHSVLLVGGSSRIPLVAQLITSELGRPIALDAHPKHSVALGAARVAAELTETAAAGIPAADARRGAKARPPGTAAAGSVAAASFVAPVGDARGAVALAPPPASHSQEAGPGRRQPSFEVPTSAQPSQGPADHAYSHHTAGTPGAPEPTPADPAGSAGSEPAEPRSRRRQRGLLAAATAVLLALLGYLMLRPGATDGDKSAESSPRSPSAALPAAAPEAAGEWPSDRHSTHPDRPGEGTDPDDSNGGPFGEGDGPDGGSTETGTIGGGGGSRPGGSDKSDQAGPGGQVTTTDRPPDSTTTTAPRRPRVPRVVGKDLATAVADIEAAGFVAAHDDLCPASEVCEVTAQDPPGGQRAAPGSTVHLTVEAIPV